MKKKVLKHLKEDMKMFKREAGEDKKLMHDIKKEHKPKESKGFRKKVSKVMHEYKEGKLHSGSKKGPVVTNPKQAIAISISEAKRRKK